MSNSVTYSMMKRHEIPDCVKVLADAFSTYEYFTYFFPEEKLRMNVLHKVLMSEFSATYGIVDTLVARENGNIVGVCQLFPPTYKKPSDLQYMIHGWWKVLLIHPQVLVKDWLKMDENASKPCHELIGDSTWYVSSMVVSPKYQQKGVGTAFFKNGIEPYVKQKGGSRITLFTNAERNCRFYEKLGYKLFHETSIHYNQNVMGSWSYIKNI